MEEIIRRYLAAFDQLNIILETYDLDDPDKKTDADDVILWFDDFMIDAYLEGFAVIGWLLDDDEDRMPDYGKIYSTIEKPYEGKTAYDRIREYVADRDSESLKRVFETEFHRVYNTGSHDRAEAVEKSLNQKPERGEERKHVMKTWLTMRDYRVRETHRYIEGISIPMDSVFATFDGDEAQFPGGFSRVENNANCRCILKYSVV